MNRKSFALAALALLASAAFTACTADEDIESSLAPAAESDAITFCVNNTAARTSTRDMETSVTDFKVSATDGANTYFSSPLNVFSTDNGASWTSSSKTSWPASRPADWKGLTFVAYVDRSHNGSSFELNDGTASFTDYTVPADVREQSDLMYAVAKDVRGGNVGLRFRHALSQITFTAQNNHPAYAGIEIISIELGGVKGHGTYTFPQASTSAAAHGQWTLDENAAPGSYSISNLGVRLAACGADRNGETVTISSTTRSEGDNVMYLIPQQVEEGAYIKVTARMTLQDAPDASYISEEIIPISADWKEGQRYNYNIAWNATPITFDVKVGDFREVSVIADL
ncbi:MAG: fimbrillin family protein [Muribaculaceae bacterium]|nr:fimbrillin family protein [Muribaculaceae bacterium]